MVGWGASPRPRLLGKLRSRVSLHCNFTDNCETDRAVRGNNSSRWPKRTQVRRDASWTRCGPVRRRYYEMGYGPPGHGLPSRLRHGPMTSLFECRNAWPRGPSWRRDGQWLLMTIFPVLYHIFRRSSLSLVPSRGRSLVSRGTIPI